MLCTSFAASSMSQTAEADVKKAINSLFDAMRNSDSVQIFSIFTPDAMMQSVVKDKEGITSVRKNQVQQFASAIGKMAKGAADEQIEFETIKLDGDLAFA